MKSIGIDIGKRKCAVCVMDEKRSVLYETEYPNTFADAKALASRMKRKYGRCQAVCESTGNLWIKTFEAFEDVKIPIKLANTFKLKIISETDVKTDPIDARKLADVLRAGMVPQCYVATPESRDRRELVRYRIHMVQDRTGVINRTRSLLDKYDVHIYASQLYSKKALGLLANVSLKRPNDNIVLKSCAQRIGDMTEQISSIDKEIASQASVSKNAKLLMSMTGIDYFIAVLLMAEIDDIGRFATADQLVSWAGMCPRVYQSGDREYHGRMKKAANRNVNWATIQAAQAAVQHDPRMKLVYERVKKRNGGRHTIAVTHVATKMLRIIWKMLVTQTPYSTRDSDRYARKLARLMK